MPLSINEEAEFHSQEIAYKTLVARPSYQQIPSLPLCYQEDWLRGNLASLARRRYSANIPIILQS